MWYRSGLFAVLAWSLGCSDTGSSPPASQVDEENPAVVSPGVTEPAANGAAFQLWIDGWTDSIDAKAQLNVTEGVSAVQLQITGGGQRDIILLDVDFDGLAGSMGQHRLEMGLPGGELDSAVASLDGQPYHSQGGQIQVSLSSDGNITGSFDVTIAQDPEVVQGGPIVFELSDDVRSLKGQFSGKWNLFCQSHMPGHMSALVRGGDYCDSLKF
jgi:hypothetical protein